MLTYVGLPVWCLRSRAVELFDKQQSLLGAYTWLSCMYCGRLEEQEVLCGSSGAWCRCLRVYCV